MKEWEKYWRTPTRLNYAILQRVWIEKEKDRIVEVTEEVEETFRGREEKIREYTSSENSLLAKGQFSITERLDCTLWSFISRSNERYEAIRRDWLALFLGPRSFPDGQSCGTWSLNSRVWIARRSWGSASCHISFLTTRQVREIRSQ